MIRNSVILDYGNKPMLDDYGDHFQKMIVSPRLAEESSYNAILSTLGPRVSAWVQPFGATYQGKKVEDWAWDQAIWQIASKRHGLLRDQEGVAVGITGSDIEAAYVLGLGDPDIAEEFRELIEGLSIQGLILFDYATWDLKWEQSIQGVTDLEWLKWAYGWNRLRESFAFAIMQNNKPVNTHPLVLEKCGWDLNPLQNVLRIAAASGEKNILICDDLTPTARHNVAAIALLFDQYFSWRRNDIGPELLWADDMEWYDEVAKQDGRSGIWYRQGNKGRVLFNGSNRKRFFRLVYAVEPWCGRVMDYKDGEVI